MAAAVEHATIVRQGQDFASVRAVKHFDADAEAMGVTRRER